MDTTQILKGLLEGCILKIIQKKTVYGYEMITLLSEYGLNMVSEGSIYPILLKLQKQQLITGKMCPSSEGPKRKYYSLTSTGEAYLQQFEKQWLLVSTGVNNILENEGLK
ncbi:PadR family transcriptional regulator, regulatory protein PadR [Enterococcus sp. DIV0212c]|uniref:PadR family transcriptional regulator n=1 Tax=Enterococcus sp. DIV0212c TaxID=2230867 RepID=UPI001A9B38A9|nr:PadR family transcriptional regulator [Enterococcus sp. DIV0212c]MBO1352699.1 PadR family transcriptional regulator [Enterococcus sp. DIV0212c]